ncbi:MAG: VTT domain-containing protein [bacterium]|nr:VTT domain-containing protein [bacterium]
MRSIKGLRITLLFLLIATIIIIPFICFEAAINQWFETTLANNANARWTIAGILFGSLSLDIFLPVPSSLASTLCGQCFGIFYGFWMSFSAMTVSSLLGYGLGRYAQTTARKLLGEREANLLTTFFEHHGIPTLIALRTVPILAEASVLFAGIAKYRFWPTLWATLLGNALVSLLYAIVGHLGHESDAMLPAFLASIILSGVFLWIFWSYQKKKHPQGVEKKDSL